MATKKMKVYLVFCAADQSLRVVRNLRDLAWDELAFEITINVPDPWGRLAGVIVIDLPEDGPAVIEVQLETPAEGDQA
jgi:hypothetical protein